MAANIEEIFQDFILNKIREIEDQNEDKSYVNVFIFLFSINISSKLTLINQMNKRYSFVTAATGCQIYPNVRSEH